jgi:glyoxylate/succinic semialdehyde reductase
MQCDPLVAEGAVAAASPCEVVEQCDITFAMLADPEAALKVGAGGIGSS